MARKIAILPCVIGGALLGLVVVQNQFTVEFFCNGSIEASRIWVSINSKNQIAPSNHLIGIVFGIDI